MDDEPRLPTVDWFLQTSNLPSLPTKIPSVFSDANPQKLETVSFANGSITLLRVNLVSGHAEPSAEVVRRRGLPNRERSPAVQLR